jgi:hypothetical protein
MYKEFTITDQYNRFVEFCIIKKQEYIEEFHKHSFEAELVRHKLLDNNYNLIVQYKVADRILHWDKDAKPIKVRNLILEDQLFISDFNDFIELKRKAQIAIEGVSKYTFYSNLTLNYYRIIVGHIHMQVSKILIEGYSFNFPVIGSIYLSRVPYNSSIPDWYRSLQFKKTLIENNIAVKTKDCIDGANWFVDNGLDREDFLLVKWRRRRSKLKNGQFYKFKPSHNKTLYISEHKGIPMEIDEMATSKKHGLFDKVMHLYKFHYDYVRKTFNFYKKQDTTK